MIHEGHQGHEGYGQAAGLGDDLAVAAGFAKFAPSESCHRPMRRQRPVVLLGDHLRRITVNINARRISVALVGAASILMASAYGTSAGEKGEKLSPAVGKIELKDGKGEIKVSWYDGGLLPNLPDELLPGEQFGGDDGGCLFIGTKGKLMVDCYGERPRLLPQFTLCGIKA